MLLKLISKFKYFQRRRARKINRNAIKSMGFTVIQINVGGQPVLYHLQDKAGKIHTNNGVGYTSSAEIRQEAERLQKLPLDRGNSEIRKAA